MGTEPLSVIGLFLAAVLIANIVWPVLRLIAKIVWRVLRLLSSKRVADFCRRFPWTVRFSIFTVSLIVYVLSLIMGKVEGVWDDMYEAPVLFLASWWLGCMYGLICLSWILLHHYGDLFVHVNGAVLFASQTGLHFFLSSVLHGASKTLFCAILAMDLLVFGAWMFLFTTIKEETKVAPTPISPAVPMAVVESTNKDIDIADVRQRRLVYYNKQLLH